MMIDEGATTVEFDGAIAVVHFQMESPRAVFTGDGFGEVEEAGANSLPSMGGFDEQLVDPGTFAAILQAEIEADDQVGDGSALLADQINEAIAWIVEEFGEIVSDAEFIKGLGPWIIVLHVAHQKKQGFEVGMVGAKKTERHEKWQPFGWR